MLKLVRLLAAVALCLGAGASSFAASDFPAEKPVTIIVPFAPGGSVDTGVRLIVPALERHLGTAVEVQNIGGGGGQSGLTEFVLKAKPDGYTIVNIGLPTVLTQYHDSSRQAIYDHSSFLSIGQGWSGAYGIAVPVDSPFNTLQELVEAARQAPETITVADTGRMAAPHLLLAMFESQHDVQFASVHMQGGSAATVALLGGHVQALVSGSGDFAALLASNSARILGLAAEERWEKLPDVPTMTEAGFPFLFESRQGFAVPAGTPPEIAATLEQALEAALADPETLKAFETYGNKADFISGERFDEIWTELDRDLAPVIVSLIEAGGA